jgi:hypothetical protein
VEAILNPIRIEGLRARGMLQPWVTTEETRTTHQDAWSFILCSWLEYIVCWHVDCIESSRIRTDASVRDEGRTYCVAHVITHLLLKTLTEACGI